MEDKVKVKKRLENLAKQYDVGRQRHEQLTQERDALGGQLNALAGAIQTCKEILDEPVIEQKPPTRQQQRAAKRKVPLKK